MKSCDLKKVTGFLSLTHKQKDFKMNIKTKTGSWKNKLPRKSKKEFIKRFGIGEYHATRIVNEVVFESNEMILKI